VKRKGIHLKRRRRPSLFSVCMCLMLAVVVSFCAFISAKYLFARKSDTTAAALPFYFESDYLASEWMTYTLQEGVDTIEVELYNYADELRYSEVDIVSTVTLKSGTDTIGTREISLKAGERSSQSVHFEDLAPGTYTVTAASSPYYKSLVANFVIRAVDDGLHYTVSDNKGSPFLKVEVTSGHYAGPISITWPAGVRPDNTDPLLLEAGGNRCEVAMEAYSSYTFMFFKDDPSAIYDSSVIIAEKISG